MEIKDGFNSKPLRIKINSQENGNIELWIEQEGLPDTPETYKYRETLSYITADELYQLYKEVKLAGKDLFN